MVEGRCDMVVKNLEHQATDTEDGHPDYTPIPPHIMRGGHQTQPSKDRLVRVSTCGDTKAVSSRTRAVSYAKVKDCDSMKQEDTIGNSLLNYITVNGVKLGKKQMVGKDDKTTMVNNKNKNKKNSEKENKKTTPSTNGIKNYFVKKHENKDDPRKISPGTDGEDNQDNIIKKTSPLKLTSKTCKEDKMVRGLVNKFECEETARSMKKTFTSNSKTVKTVSKKIEDFNKISSNSVKCLIGSGRCASHNTKVVRSVQQKKTSVILKNGEIGWRMCEAVILSCPAVTRDGGPSDVSEPNLSNRVDVIANKKARVSGNFETFGRNQSDLSTENVIENNTRDDTNG